MLSKSMEELSTERKGGRELKKRVEEMEPAWASDKHSAGLGRCVSRKWRRHVLLKRL